MVFIKLTKMKHQDILSLFEHPQDCIDASVVLKVVHRFRKSFIIQLKQKLFKGWSVRWTYTMTWLYVVLMPRITIEMLMHFWNDNKIRILQLTKESAELINLKLSFLVLVFPLMELVNLLIIIQALKDATSATTQSEVSSLLGLSTYSSRFIKNHTIINDPLRM